MSLLGCVLGGAVGDGLGAPIEFSSIDVIRRLYGPAGVVDLPQLEITDDTQMVLFTLEGLLLARQHGIDPVLAVRAAYGRWLHTQGGPAVASDGWLMADQFHVDRWLGAVDEPVFVAHGTADRTIPVSHGERVYALVRNKAGLWIVPGADHSDLWKAGIWDKAQAFFEAAEQGKGAGSRPQ